ncbi:1-phosphofructokinase family hexose kinase [Mycolicibacterium sp. P9-64]|uniref:1-phosphofructokinase family hexose kinase n=1 Tax=Mycolicibacterium sp. P9-64 TaxID=2024612 RepID=UPI0011ED382C|nr:hexose kinase [Mycolicibacterium sp. P9-64]KAA0081842.1 1-phosphofructokinase family hexose kinase [Mycolicibacterium sp. P9-64]
MITTVTPNPSLDRTLRLPRMTLGQVNRATATMVEPSGKGVNVAIALHGAGVDVRAVLPVGGGAGIEICSLLDDLGVEHVDVPIAGAVRSNVSLVEADGRSTKVNEPGPLLSGAEVDALCARASAGSGVAEWVLWAGSLPGGFTPQRFADAVADNRRAGSLVAVDSSGPALTRVISQHGDRLPHMVKPNAEELAELAGRELTTLGDVADAARVLLVRGVRTVLISLGHNGALLVDADLPEPLHGRSAARRVVNTVGAGDAFLAGWLAALDAAADPADALANALRFGATAVEQEGTLLGLPNPDRPVTIVAAEALTPLG